MLVDRSVRGIQQRYRHLWERVNQQQQFDKQDVLFFRVFAV